LAEIVASRPFSSEWKDDDGNRYEWVLESTTKGFALRFVTTDADDTADRIVDATARDLNDLLAWMNRENLLEPNHTLPEGSGGNADNVRSRAVEYFDPDDDE